MSRIRILIVEDVEIEAAALTQRLKSLGYEVVAHATSGLDSIAQYKQHDPDIVIMDINLEGKMDGVEAANKMQDIAYVPVLFLTDRSDKKAIDGAAKTIWAEFLLKPYDERRLGAALQLLVERSLQNPVEDQEGCYSVTDGIFVPGKDGFRKVLFADILFVMADRSYSTIHTTETKFELSQNSGKVTQKIDHPSIIRVHRKYHVNLDRVDGIAGNTLSIGEKTIPIGESYKVDVKNRFRIMRFG